MIRLVALVAAMMGWFAMAAGANPTAYDVAAMLQQRDVFADRFWGLLQAPAAPVAAPGVGNRLYDFEQVIRRPDPFANAFWGVAAPAAPGALR